ncbi:MAG: GTPase domain-containing protein [Bacillota bacterium]|nr:GTPase domain-containing protein [Bacillota bacterium]
MSREGPVALLVGRPGVGKSALFRLLAASPAGPGDGMGRGWPVRRPQERRTRPGPPPPLGVACRWYRLELGRGRVERLLLVEGASVPERLPAAVAERRRLGETLLLLEDAEMVLHVLDGPRLGLEPEASWLHPIDEELQRIGVRRPAYAAVVSGTDRPWGPTGLARLRERWSGLPVFPFSAATREGVREIRSWLREQLGRARVR